MKHGAIYLIGDLNTFQNHNAEYHCFDCYFLMTLYSDNPEFTARLTSNTSNQRLELVIFSVVTLCVCVLSCFARLGVIPVFLLALTITLALVFFPRSPETTPPFKEIEVNSTHWSHTPLHTFRNSNTLTNLSF